MAEGRDLGCSPRGSQGKSEEISQRRGEGPHNPEERGQLVSEGQGGDKDTRKVFRSFWGEKKEHQTKDLKTKTPLGLFHLQTECIVFVISTLFWSLKGNPLNL